AGRWVRPLAVFTLLGGAMRQLRMTVSCQAIAVLALLTCFDAALARQPDFVADEVLIGFEESATRTQIGDFEAEHRLKLRRDFAHIRVRQYALPKGLSVEQAMRELNQAGLVRFVEPNFIHRRQAAPNDPRFLEQWSLQNTGQVVNGKVGPAG